MNYYNIDNLPLGLKKSLLDTEIEKLAIGIEKHLIRRVRFITVLSGENLA